MDEPMPRMTLHLGSRYTVASDMAVALFWAIEDAGLRIPPRRDVARHARISEATVSRRFRESRTSEQNLVSRLIRARRATHPRGWRGEGWQRWLPETGTDLQDVRVWLSCLALAAYGPGAAEVLLDAWDTEREEIRLELGSCAVQVSDELVQAVLIGLSIRRALDPTLSHEHAVELLSPLLDGPARAPSQSSDA